MSSGGINFNYFHDNQHYIISIAVCNVTKSGGLRNLKAYEFEKWGIEPSSLVELYAYGLQWS